MLSAVFRRAISFRSSTAAVVIWLISRACCVLLSGRNYSALQADFILRRHTGYFMINFYVPISLLVIISWVGFWINREATADRISLGKSLDARTNSAYVKNRCMHRSTLFLFEGYWCKNIIAQYRWLYGLRFRVACV